MGSDVRVDPLTGTRSVHPDLRSKPFPKRERALPELCGPCVFCRIANETPDSAGTITDGELRRPLKISGETTLTIENRWSPFGEDAKADLVLPRRHATSLEELTALETVEFFEQLLDVLLSHESHPEAGRSLAFSNVGRPAGSSQPHFHGQVVSTSIVGEGMLPLNLRPRAIASDVDSAISNGTVISLEPVLTYAAWAPSSAGELRVVSYDIVTLAHGVRRVLCALTEHFGQLPYNIVLHRSHCLVVQLLPRFVMGGVLSSYFGLLPVEVSPAAVAAALRTSF